jgi:hypothetical protein
VLVNPQEESVNEALHLPADCTEAVDIYSGERVILMEHTLELTVPALDVRVWKLLA